MKQLNLVLNIVLLVAVGILYFLHFRQVPGGEITPAAPPVAVSVKPSTIVFFNNDSLNEQYSFLKAKRAELEARHEKVSRELEAQAEKFQADAENYAKQGGSMTMDQRMKTEEELMQRRDQLQRNEKLQMSKFEDERDRINEELYTNLDNFLKELNKTRKYDFILAHSRGSQIMLANDSLDITREVVDGLNKRYEGTSTKK